MQMLSPRLAVADPARRAAVASYGLTGHAGDADLDGVVDHMARMVRAPMAVINMVGSDLQCYPAERGVGAPSTDVPDELSFCAYVVAERAPLTVADARSHPVFSENPLVASGAISAYLGVPLLDEDGFVLGALSVFDASPREFTDEDRAVLETQMNLVRALLSLRRRVAAHEWDAELLAAQGRVLESVAVGGSLPATLDELAATVQRLSARASGVQLAALRTTADRLTRVAVDADQWRRQAEQLAQRDALTGLANRAHFTETGRLALLGGGAVLFIDLDRFKEVNDRGGHALGDQLLVRVAKRLQRRVTEAVPGSVVGRLGGDEFAVVVPGVDQDTAERLGEELVAALVEHVQSGRRWVRVSASIGLAMAAAGTDLTDVVKSADTAMYEAKARGRGCLHVL